MGWVAAVGSGAEMTVLGGASLIEFFFATRVGLR